MAAQRLAGPAGSWTGCRHSWREPSAAVSTYLACVKAGHLVLFGEVLLIAGLHWRRTQVCYFRVKARFSMIRADT